MHANVGACVKLCLFVVGGMHLCMSAHVIIDSTNASH